MTGVPIDQYSVDAAEGRARQAQIRFENENVLVRPGQPITVKWGWHKLLGKGLPVPPGHYAVLFLPEGCFKVIPHGNTVVHTIPSGEHAVCFVDVREQTTSLPPITAKSADSWEVTLVVDVNWRVSDPVRITAIKYPVASIRRTCMAAVADVIRGHHHDRLIANPDQGCVDNLAIAKAIERKLLRSSIFKWLQLEDIVVRDRKGDARRTEEIQLARIEKTRIAQQRSVLSERSEFRAAQLEMQAMLAAKDRDIALEEAKTTWMSEAEKDNLRLIKAENDTEAALRSRVALFQDVDVKNREQALQFEVELLKEALKQQGKSSRSVAVVIGHVLAQPGITQAMDRETIEALRLVVRETNQSFSQHPRISNPISEDLSASALLNKIKLGTQNGDQRTREHSSKSKGNHNGRTKTG